MLPCQLVNLPQRIWEIQQSSECNQQRTNLVQGRYFVEILRNVKAIVLVATVSSLRMEYFMSKLLPLLIGSIVFLLSAIGLVQEILARDKSKATVTEDKTPGEQKAEARLREYLPMGAWLGGISLAI